MSKKNTSTTPATEATPKEKKAREPMAKVLSLHRKDYKTCTSFSGKPSLDNDDQLAQALRGLTPDKVVATAERLCGLKSGELKARYAKLNNGQRRMNAGNRIRGAVKRQDVTFADVKAAI